MASDQTSDPAALHFVTTQVILESSFSGNGSSNSRGFLGPLTIMSFRISNVPRFNDCFCVRNKKNQINPFIQQDKGRPLPKFGEWDVNNPASAEGFTVIFNKARDEKKTNGQGGATIPPQKPTGGYKPDHDYDFPTKSKWFCCG